MEAWTTQNVTDLLALLTSIQGLVEVGAFALCTIAGVFFLRLVILGKNQRTLFAVAAVLLPGAVCNASTFSLSFADAPGGVQSSEPLRLWVEGQGMGAMTGVSGALYHYEGSFYGMYRNRVATDGGGVAELIIYVQIWVELGNVRARVEWDGGSIAHDAWYTVQANGNVRLWSNVHDVGGTKYSTVVLQVTDDVFDYLGMGGGSGGAGAFPDSGNFDHEAANTTTATDAQSNINKLKTKLQAFSTGIDVDAANEGPSTVVFAFGYSGPQGANLSNAGLNNVQFNYRFTPGSVPDNARLTARAIFILFFAALFMHGVLGTVKRW